METSCRPGPLSSRTSNDHRDSYGCIGVVPCNRGDWLPSLFSAIAQDEVVGTPDPDRVRRWMRRGEDERRHGSKDQEYGHRSEFDHGRRDVGCRGKREAMKA
jgi:hypothetical protein